MTELPDNILHLRNTKVLGCKSTVDEMHFQVNVPDPIGCEGCGVQGEFARFGKRLKLWAVSSPPVHLPGLKEYL